MHRLPPVGDPYVLNLWHKDRLAYTGYYVEAKVLAKALLVRNRPAKFLIFGRPRSGTTLLRRLLNQVRGIHCDGEMLHHAVWAPHFFLNRLAQIKTARAYGSKLLSYQMLEVQRIADPAGFLEGLVADGYRLVHVRRDTFDQALSLAVAQAGHGYHVQATQAVGLRDVTLDPDAFVRNYRFQQAMLDYEDLLMSELPHLVVQYERDLRSSEQHQDTVERICAALGLSPDKVAADLNRLADRTVVRNVDALRARVESLNATSRSTS